MKKNYKQKNPVIQTNYTADPAPMVYKDRVYLYTSHDEDGSDWFTMNEWLCYSSADMVNWTDHGAPLHYTEFEWARGDAWAAQCIEKDDKFYLYVPVNQKDAGMAIGVAVSDSPTGPFKDPLGHPLVTTGTGDIDPTAFIDDDGQAYLYWGNPYLWYVKLNDDLISYDQEVGVVEVPLTEEGFGKRDSDDPKRPTLYEEAPWFYKRNGLYYMVFAASGIPENIGYATSYSPTGPWTFRGIIMPTEGGSFTNHPGLCDFKGRSYFFYHNAALPGGGGFNRSVCIEEFKYNPDGTIPTLHMTTEGVEPVAHFNPYEKTKAVTISWSAGVRTEPSSQGGMNVCKIDDGDFIRVSHVDFGEAGAKSFDASVSSVIEGGKIELRLDKPDGDLIGVLDVPNTGEFDNWQTVSTDISGAKGVHDLFFVFKGEGKDNLFKFDHWKFS